MTKRRRNDSMTDYDNNKKPKEIIYKNISSLEDLSNELFYDIFDYLLNHHAFQAFYDLNNRFKKLFLNSNYPISINISSISKLTFEHYVKHIIKPCASRIESIRLANPCIDPCSLLIPIMKQFTQLSTLCLNSIEANYIESILNHLSSLPVLSSLTIVSIDNIIDKNNVYSKLFHLPMLKYCELCIEFLKCPKSFLPATNKFSSFEHLIINHDISTDQLLILLSYVPQLRRLSINRLRESEVSPTGIKSINLNYLTHVSVKAVLSFHVPFHELEILIVNCFRQVQVLSFAIQFTSFDNHRGYIDSDNWQRVISNYMFNLRIFDFQCSFRGLRSNDEHQRFVNLTDKFNSIFWINHQWFFNRHYHKLTWSNAAIFYSQNSSKKDSNRLAENMWSSRHDINEDPMHHICIHQTKTIKEPLDKFLHAKELTLCEAFEVPRNPIVDDLNHFYPLKQLTKLSIECHHFSFQQLIELLQYTSNVHTLTLDSIILKRLDLNSIQQHENKITKLTIKKEITFAKIQIITDVFLRMEDLTINLFEKDLVLIAQYLLTNTRYLSSLCISKQRRDFPIILENLIKSEKLLRDFVLKVINRIVYLWW